MPTIDVPAYDREHFECLSAADVIARFCALQSAVVSGMDAYQSANDCFCRDPSRGGLSWRAAPQTFRNSGQALHWIETVVRTALDKIAILPQED